MLAAFGNLIKCGTAMHPIFCLLLTKRFAFLLKSYITGQTTMNDKPEFLRLKTNDRIRKSLPLQNSIHFYVEKNERRYDILSSAHSTKFNSCKAIKWYFRPLICCSEICVAYFAQRTSVPLSINKYGVEQHKRADSLETAQNFAHSMHTGLWRNG